MSIRTYYNRLQNSAGMIAEVIYVEWYGGSAIVKFGRKPKEKKKYRGVVIWKRDL